MSSVIIILKPILVGIVVGLVLNVIKRITAKRALLKSASFHEDVNLLKSNVSYDIFCDVAKESLRPNSPKRSSGDFFDFYLENIYKPAPSCTWETDLLRYDYGFHNS